MKDQKNLAELGRKRLFQNLLKKLNDGKTLTANERRQYDELSDAFTEQPPSSAGDPLDVPRGVAANFFSVTAQTIQNWVDKGMPKLSRGLYNLKECFKWWAINIDGGGTEEMDAHKTRYWKEKADEAEISNQTTRGELISRADVVREWVWRISELRTGLRAWASRLPPILEGKSAIELRLSLRDAADELLEAYARDGRFTPSKDRTKPAKKARRKNR